MTTTTIAAAPSTSNVALQETILYTLKAQNEPMTKARIVKIAGLASKSGTQLKRAFDALEENGMVKRVADGFVATGEGTAAVDVPADEVEEAPEQPEDGGAVIGGSALKQAKAVVNAKTQEQQNEEYAELRQIADRVIEYVPDGGAAPIGIKADCAALDATGRKTVRGMVISHFGAGSPESGARFTAFGLFTQEDIEIAKQESEKRRAQPKTRKAATSDGTPKASKATGDSVAFTTAYKARKGSLCAIAGLAAFAADAKKGVTFAQLEEAIVAERPDDKKYTNEAVRLLVKREVLVETKDKDGKTTAYTMPSTVRAMLKEQSAATGAKTAVAAS